MAAKTGSNQKKRVNKGDDEYLETFNHLVNLLSSRQLLSARQNMGNMVFYNVNSIGNDKIYYLWTMVHGLNGINNIYCSSHIYCSLPDVSTIVRSTIKEPTQ
eukprot:179822_1